MTLSLVHIPPIRGEADSQLMMLNGMRTFVSHSLVCGSLSYFPARIKAEDPLVGISSRDRKYLHSSCWLKVAGTRISLLWICAESFAWTRDLRIRGIISPAAGWSWVAPGSWLSLLMRPFPGLLLCLCWAYWNETLLPLEVSLFSSLLFCRLRGSMKKSLSCSWMHLCLILVDERAVVGSRSNFVMYQVICWLLSKFRIIRPA